MSLRATSGWAVLVVLAAVGCGGSASSPDTHQGVGGGEGTALTFARSGTRLSALGYASNGARVFSTFHDEQLGFDCSFATASNGADQRCVPNATFDVVYTDAACTEAAVWFWPEQNNAPRLGGVVSGSVPAVAACPGDAPRHRDAFRVGEQLSEEVIAGSVIDVFALRDGRCQPTEYSGKVTPPLHRVVPVSESEFVRGERANLDAGGGLRVTRLVADDGAQLTLGVTVADRTPCEFQRDGECVPEPIARSADVDAGRFLQAVNAECTEPAFTVPYSKSCGVAKFGVEDDHANVLRVRTMKTPGTLFRWEVDPFSEPRRGIICSVLEPDNYTTVVAPDRDLTGTFPAAQRLRRGTGPLYVDWFGLGNNELLPVQADFRRASPGVVPKGDFVNEAGRACAVTRADDGTFRCVLVDENGIFDAEVSTSPQVTLEKF